MFWVAQRLVIAEGDSGAPGRLHLPSKLLGWNTGARGRWHPPSNLPGWIVHHHSNLLEWY